MKDVDGSLDIQAYIAQHPFMYTGKPGKFLIRVKKKWINHQQWEPVELN